MHLDVSTYGYRPTVAIKNRHARAVERVMPIFTKAGAAKVPWQERLAVAESLGRAGDPRLHDPPRKRMLPVGLQGSGRPVLLGKYPVTVEEYRHFVGQRGYEERRYWVGEDREEGWEVRDRERWEGSRPAARVLVPLGRVSTLFARWRSEEPAARAWKFPA